MKSRETIQDLVEEAKLRTVWWGLCIFTVTYILTHTSTSMWMNLPIAILIVCGGRILSNEVEFSWKVREAPKQPYLSRLEKKQLALNDPRLSSGLPPPRWKNKINSPLVETAINEFTDKILRDFVIDLWYSEITPDKEAPELMRSVIMEAIGEVSRRIKEINLVDLLTRDMVDLIGDHLDLFRKNQAAIGVDVMKTLSSEERDERLKYHLMASGELYPALICQESEYKVLQRLVAGVLSIVLRPREAQCPLVRTIAREIVTCLVLQPILNLATPERINEVMEYIIVTVKEGFSLSGLGLVCDDTTSWKGSSFDGQAKNVALDNIKDPKELSSDEKKCLEETMQPHLADWARKLEAATQRRTEILAPENLENMWTKGRNYKKKEYKKALKEGLVRNDGRNHSDANRRCGTYTRSDEKEALRLPPKPSLDLQLHDGNKKWVSLTEDVNKASPFGGSLLDKGNNVASDGNNKRLKRSNSTSDLRLQPDMNAFAGSGEGLIPQFYSPDYVKHIEELKKTKKTSSITYQKEGPHLANLRCRVVGAYFEKLGSKSFAVYSIAVTDAENRTWFVKRRYSNFERLHRQLKEIPNYNLHLPPKRIFSSSTEDAFVHQRCIQLDKYLQDLLCIANVAEQHEVLDFLSISSKNYSFGKSSSVMRTLAVNVDDAMDDIVRQFKGVSDGLMRKVVGPPSSLDESYAAASSRHLSLTTDDLRKSIRSEITSGSLNSNSDSEDTKKDGGGNEENGSCSESSGCQSEDDLSSKAFPPRLTRCAEELGNSLSEKHGEKAGKFESTGMNEIWDGNLKNFEQLENATVPPEWTPPNVSVPMLNLVDKVFQLKRRGWLRRQVFWISKQILQLVMEDAIDEWLLSQICWLRNEETIAQGIRWVQDILWPNDVFFTRVGNLSSQTDDAGSSPRPFPILGQIGASKVSRPSSFEQQLEATRRASDVKKFLFEGAPAALVSLIGPKQYRRCARDIYYFTQSTTCVKQLAYAILELVLKSIFPELRDLLTDILHNRHGKSP